MDWLNDHLVEAWLAVGLLLGVAEMFSLDLVMIMLAVGAFAGMTMALISAPIAVQILVAAGSSVAMLALVRPPMAKKFHSGPDLRLGHNKLLGTQGVVIEEITGTTTGRVRLSGEIWSALPYDETITIVPGETIEVLQIKGATAYVHPVPTLEI